MNDNPNTWTMYAQRHNNGVYMHVNSCEHTVACYGAAESIVPVEVREVADDDPTATHWGWIDNPDTWTGARMNRDFTIPVMIQPHQGMFDMQFPYNPNAEVDRGRGRIARLAIKEVTTS